MFSFTASHNINYLIRGLRNTTDYMYEENIAKFNYELNPDLKTIYFRGTNDVISSSMIRELIKYNYWGKVQSDVPRAIYDLLRASN